MAGLCRPRLRAGCWGLLLLVVPATSGAAPDGAGAGLEPPVWSGPGREEQKRYFEEVYAHAEWFSGEGLGEFCMEAESIFHVMKRSYSRQRRKSIFVDVGSNTGNAIAAMVGTFNDRRLGPLTIWAFEPNPESFVSLERGLKAEGGLGTFHNIEVVQAAVSDRQGTASFFHRGWGDVLAGLAHHPARETWNNGRSKDTEVSVQVVSLDEVFGPTARIHLLKIDAEGYDPLVLRGARRLLSSRRVKFIVFEYDEVWKTAGHNLTLQDATQELHARGFSCFFMTKAALLPLFADWWQRAYDSIEWGNVFCGQSNDHDLFDAYLSHGSSNNFTLAFALRSLRAGSPRALRWAH